MVFEATFLRLIGSSWRRRFVDSWTSSPAEHPLLSSSSVPIQISSPNPPLNFPKPNPESTPDLSWFLILASPSENPRFQNRTHSHLSVDPGRDIPLRLAFSTAQSQPRHLAPLPLRLRVRRFQTSIHSKSPLAPAPLPIRVHSRKTRFFETLSVLFPISTCLRIQTKAVCKSSFPVSSTRFESCPPRRMKP